MACVVGVFCRLGGTGYKALARLPNSLSGDFRCGAIYTLKKGKIHLGGFAKILSMMKPRKRCKAGEIAYSSLFLIEWF